MLETTFTKSFAYNHQELCFPNTCKSTNYACIHINLLMKLWTNLYSIVMHQVIHKTKVK